MIEEKRRITFGVPALMAAFEDQAGMLARLGMTSPPIMISVVPARQALEICSFDEQKGCIGEVDFGGAALAALLMAQCKRRGLPLPRRSRKLLEFNAESVSLLFESETEAKHS